MLMKCVSLSVSRLLIADLTRRLRRAVLHPNLVIPAGTDDKALGGETVDIEALIQSFTQGEGSNGNVFAEGALQNLGMDDNTECPICLDVMEKAMIIPGCMHKWYAFFSGVEMSDHSNLPPAVARTVLSLSSRIVRRKASQGVVLPARTVLSRSISLTLSP